VADGKLSGITIEATMFTVRTDPKVVALAPVIITEHLIAIRARRVKVVNAILAHCPTGRVFQVVRG
jgi:hypothetical protein